MVLICLTLKIVISCPNFYKLIHDYLGVDVEVIRNSAISDLPELETKLNHRI